MAFLKLSGLLSSITGKLNGSYFSQKKGATTMNTNPARINKANTNRTSLQQVQLAFAKQSRNWRNLTEEAKLAWTNYAGTLTFYNKAGLPYTPTGYEVYVSCNLNLKVIGSANIPLPVVSEGDGDINKVDVSFSITNILELNYTGGAVTDAGIVVYASAPQSAGVNRPIGGYKKIYSNNTIPVGATSLNSGYLATYGYYPLLGMIFFRVEIITPSSGRKKGGKLTKADSGFV